MILVFALLKVTKLVESNKATLSQTILTAFCSLGEVVDGDVGLVGDGVLADVVLDPAVRNLPLLGIDPRQVGVVGLQGANSINNLNPLRLLCCIFRLLWAFI